MPAPASLRIQTVLYHNQPAAVERALAGLAQACALSRARHVLRDAEVVYGDCSATPLWTRNSVERLAEKYQGVLRLDYRFFGSNLGSARGQNALADDATLDYLLIINPDILLFPDALIELLSPFGRDSDVGITEARQVPIEHPKHYDSETGETSWCMGACALLPRRVFESVQGFDADTFFMYCDDVDLSWRVRLLGYRLILKHSAVAFHDKRLTRDGLWMPSSAECYYSAEAALFMAHKWSFFDRVQTLLAEFRSSGNPDQLLAAEEFERRRQTGMLPAPLDPEHRVGRIQPERGDYGDPYRFHVPL